VARPDAALLTVRFIGHAAADNWLLDPADENRTSAESKAITVRHNSE
jgi:hypothetical protein